MKKLERREREKRGEGKRRREGERKREERREEEERGGRREEEERKRGREQEERKREKRKREDEKERKREDEKERGGEEKENKKRMRGSVVLGATRPRSVVARIGRAVLENFKDERGHQSREIPRASEKRPWRHGLESGGDEWVLDRPRNVE